MIGDGELVAEKFGTQPNGRPWWRWSYTTYSDPATGQRGGRNHVGVARKSKQSALRDGEIWLEQQKKT